MFGKKSRLETSQPSRIESSLSVGDVLRRLLGNWDGDVFFQSPDGTMRKCGSATKKYHPSPDGWHIIEFSENESPKETSHHFNVIALMPNSSEVSITEFAPGNAESKVYEVVELSKRHGDTIVLTLQAMGWQGKHPCEIRMSYMASKRSLEIERSIRPTTNGSNFQTCERHVLSRR